MNIRCDWDRIDAWSWESSRGANEERDGRFPAIFLRILPRCGLLAEALALQVPVHGFRRWIYVCRM